MTDMLWHVFRYVFRLAPLCACFAVMAASGSRVAALETEWHSMGLITNEHVSRHDLSVDRRNCDIRHTLYTDFGRIIARSTTYRMDKAACEDFFAWLEDSSGISRWRDDYTDPTLVDGSEWKLRVLYEDAPAREIKGNEEPSASAERERRIRALVRFDPEPAIF